MDNPVLVVNGWVTVPASLKTPSQASRFILEFPAQMVNDVGAGYLVVHDVRGGYEAPTRNLFERVLRAGDLFIDVGAHWGFFTLQAATHPAGGIRVMALEPDPGNAAILFRNVCGNGLAGVVTVVCAACGDGFDIAPLVTNSSMGHSIRGVSLGAPQRDAAAKWVAVVSLDQCMSILPHSTQARVILKIDAEGFEPRVVAGARSLLASGRVGLIVWERGEAFATGAERQALADMVAELSQLGFRHFRPPSQEVDGPYAPFDIDDGYIGNVFSFGATFPE